MIASGFRLRGFAHTVNVVGIRSLAIGATGGLVVEGEVLHL